MVGKYVQRIIGRAVKEPAYRALLFSDPGTVLAGYPLTHEERMALARLVPESWHFIMDPTKTNGSTLNICAGIGSRSSDAPND